MLDILLVRGKYGFSSKNLTNLLKSEYGYTVRRVRNGNPAPPAKMLIYWGVKEKEYDYCGNTVINYPIFINQTANKKRFYELHSSTFKTVPFTDNKETAQQWLESGYTVMCRTLVSSSAGKGIIVCNPEDDLPDAKLYTKRIKGYEFRLHVDFHNNKLIDLTQKKKISSEKLEQLGIEYNPVIRSMSNGWVHAHEDLVHIPSDVLDEVVDVDFGLDFGAVDVIYNKYHNEMFVLEINTAPGLVNTKTIKAYADMIHDRFRSSYD